MSRSAPEGSQVGVVTERRKSEEYYSTQQTLWLVPREGGTPERLRTDDQNASLDKPIWSPDWRRLLYRISHGKTKELAILNLQSKQARTMKPCNEGETVGRTTWSPDGHRIAIICNGTSPQDKEEAKAEKNTTHTGDGKNGDEDDDDEET